MVLHHGLIWLCGSGVGLSVFGVRDSGSGIRYSVFGPGAPEGTPPLLSDVERYLNKSEAPCYPPFSSITYKMSNKTSDKVRPDIDRQASVLSDNKIDVEQQEAVNTHNSSDKDDDQVGYATFKAAQKRGYEPISTDPWIF
jgi:hypothetical protein